MWVAQLPYMGRENYVSFEAYVARVTGANIDTRPAEDIMAEIDAAQARMTGGAHSGV